MDRHSDLSILDADDVPTGRYHRSSLIDGRYQLQEVISDGGMGRIYAALHHDLGRRFALKVVHPTTRDLRRARARFTEEARLASSLEHPNIVRVTDFGRDDRVGFFLVMELLDGETVGQRMRRGPLAPRVALDLLDQLASAVRYMHGRGVVHGDIKPGNVFLARSCSEARRGHVVKVLDFGLSMGAQKLVESRLAGTPPYLAPERAAGAPPSPVCDVYSLGVMLYELVAGRAPYQGGPLEILARQACGPHPEPPSTFALLDGIGPAGVDRLVMRALAIDPTARHASAEAFHFELRALMQKNGMTIRRQRS